MKEKDLYIEFDTHKLVYYAEKEDNSYGPIISGSHLSANYLDDHWMKRKNLEEKLRKQVIANEISPIFYYMTYLEMGPKDLASRANMSMRKLSKTFKPEGFNKLKVSQLKRFADIFNIPVFSLFQTFLIKDEDHEKLELQQAATDNELYHITIINLK
jgi:transcriptional regulator with XRE-family HTH domain